MMGIHTLLTESHINCKCTLATTSTFNVVMYLYKLLQTQLVDQLQMQPGSKERHHTVV